eukprot:1155830-Pelagomonas_calceolata.AAC.6
MDCLYFPEPSSYCCCCCVAPGKPSVDLSALRKMATMQSKEASHAVSAFQPDSRPQHMYKSSSGLVAVKPNEEQLTARGGSRGDLSARCVCFLMKDVVQLYYEEQLTARGGLRNDPSARCSFVPGDFGARCVWFLIRLQFAAGCLEIWLPDDPGLVTQASDKHNAASCLWSSVASVDTCRQSYCVHVCCNAHFKLLESDACPLSGVGTTDDCHTHSCVALPRYLPRTAHFLMSGTWTIIRFLLARGEEQAVWNACVLKSSYNIDVHTHTHTHTHSHTHTLTHTHTHTHRSQRSDRGRLLREEVGMLARAATVRAHALAAASAFCSRARGSKPVLVCEVAFLFHCFRAWHPQRSLGQLVRIPSMRAAASLSMSLSVIQQCARSLAA